MYPRRIRRYFYFLDQPDNGYIQTETRNWLYLIIKVVFILPMLYPWLYYKSRDESPENYVLIEIAMSKTADKCYSTCAYPLIGDVYSTYDAFRSASML